MKNLARTSPYLLASLSLAACGTNTETFSDTFPDAATGESPSAAVDGGTGVAHGPRGIAVVQSDFQTSASVSFLDPDGNLVKDGCFKTGAAGATLTLSGDVTLPTQLRSGGDVVVIDRTNAVLTWLDAETCIPLRQLAVGTGFGANPHDYVEVSANKAYLTRFEENGAPTPAAGDFDDGDDLLIIDPSLPRIVGRIDLKPFAPAGALPRADRALLVEGKLFVSLNAIDVGYKTYGTGRILVVDPTTDQVESTVDLPGVKNCGAMTYVAAEKKLVIACGGAYSSTAKQADTSAVLVLDVAAVSPASAISLAAAAAIGAPFSNTTVAALDGSHALAVGMGDLSNNAPDRLWSLASASPASDIFDSTEAYTLSAVLMDAERNRMFVADGTSQSAAVRIFDYVAGTWQAGPAIKTNPTGKLPPHALAWF